jgi:molecular chaperone DnaJ
MLGVSREIKLPDESAVTIEIPAGTQPGEVITTRGKGVPRIDGRGRGSLHAVIDVAIPKTLSDRARRLLEDLDAELQVAPPVESSPKPATETKKAESA